MADKPAGRAEVGELDPGLAALAAEPPVPVGLDPQHAFFFAFFAFLTFLFAFLILLRSPDFFAFFSFFFARLTCFLAFLQARPGFTLIEV